MTSSCLFVDLKGNIFGRTTYHDAFSWRIYEKHVLFGLEYNVNLKEKQSLRLSGGARTQIYNVAYEGNESLNPAFVFFFFFFTILTFLGLIENFFNLKSKLMLSPKISRKRL